MRISSKSLLFIIFSLLLCASAKAQTAADEQLAAQYFQNRDFEKAADLYEKLFDKSPNGYFYSNFLLSVMELKDYKRAEKFVKKLIRKNPQQLNYAVDLGFVYSESGQPDKAKQQFDDAMNDLVSDQNMITMLANAFLVRRQNEYAINTYQKGRKLLHNNLIFAQELAFIYQQFGNYDAMLTEYLDWVENDYGSIDQVEQRLQSFLLDDPDNRKANLLKSALMKRAQKYPDKTVYSEMLIWYATQIQDFQTAYVQAKALDRRFKESGERIFNLARLCVDNKFYDVASEAFSYLIKKGNENYYYLSSRIELLNVRYLKITETATYTKDDLLSLEKEYQGALKEFGKNTETINLIKNLAHLEAFYLDKSEPAIALLQEALAFSNMKPQVLAYIKLELGDIYLFSGDQWEASLLYSQVDFAFKNDPLGAEAKFKNAKLSFYIGEFDWAKAQLDILKAATSKLIANDAMALSLTISDNLDDDSSTTGLQYYAKADLLLFRNKPDQALKTLDSIQTLGVYHPLFDEVLYKKAQIMISLKNYTEADTLLGKLIRFYPEDILGDDALFLRAQLNETLIGDKPKALACYQKLITSYTGSIYVAEARKRFRILRGDNLIAP